MLRLQRHPLSLLLKLIVGNYAGEYTNVKAPKGDPTVAMINDIVTGL